MTTPRLLQRDPFPPDAKDEHQRIACALLHSADILRYANALTTEGRPLFHPFIKDKLKPASYELTFEGDVYWWDRDQLQHRILRPDDEFIIPRNGIVFVSPRTDVCIPDYLALRFNLQISLVHRGLLLGTGPLVDPGFEGRLLIPVHNLTDSDHVVRGSDGFIWLEVTKVSQLPHDTTTGYVPFKEDKKKRTANYYFDKANAGNTRRGITSSIPSVNEQVEAAKAQLRKMSVANWISGVLSVIGVVVGIGSIAWATISIWSDTKQYVDQVRNEQTERIAREVEQRTNDLDKRIARLEDELNKLQKGRPPEGSPGRPNAH